MKRIITYILSGLVVLFFGVTVAGCVVKAKGAGRIAPGVLLCGRDISGMTTAEAEQLLGALVPKFSTELRCRVLPEMRAEVEANVKRLNQINAGRQTEENIAFSDKGCLTMQENELCLTVKAPMIRIVVEDTLEAITETSSEVKIWEWLYAAVTGGAFRERQAEAVFVWEEKFFGELLSTLAEVPERDCVEATVRWENGDIAVTESRRGFRIKTEKAWEDAEEVVKEVIARLQGGPVEGLVLRFYLDGTALMPRLSTAQAKKCNTKIGEFTTTYQGAVGGRAQNIAAGASRLHGKVILPGEEFSVAAALRPFTEENGYAAGGTYIDGQLSESIGGGVCQLSTTLYNVLLRTYLPVTERHPHSMPVGYIPLGQDAAIAGDYKDLKFKNTTKAPVLLLCEATGEEVKVTLYGSEEAKREDVTIESIVAEETEEQVTVEVYRIEKAEGGATFRERVSVDGYRYLGQ